MSTNSNFQLMARYNRWMNEKIYAAASTLSEAKVREDQGAFFNSVLGTLNHIMVGDIMWLKRFAQHAKQYSSLDALRELSNPASLDAILHEDLSSLRRARGVLDDTIVLWSQEIDDDDLARELDHTDTKDNRYSNNFGYLVQHFYNHQTHHRGQVTTLLSQNGIGIGSTDLLTLIRE